MIYEVWYRPGRDGEPGCVYLPGKGEEFYNNNTGTILRTDDDGKWHYASRKWDDLMTCAASPASTRTSTTKSWSDACCLLSTR
jgi:hypothetical protein